MTFVCTALQIYALVILARIVLGYFQVPYDHPVAKIRNGVAAVVDPLLRPIRSVMPPVRLGSMALDLSPLVLFFGVQIIQMIIC